VSSIYSKAGEELHRSSRERAGTATRRSEFEYAHIFSARHRPLFCSHAGSNKESDTLIANCHSVCEKNDGGDVQNA